MEWVHRVQHRCQLLLAGDTGWYSGSPGMHSSSSPNRDSGKRRTVFARHGPHQEDYEAICKKFKTNAIRTNKYSLLTFIPMTLFQQFHRAANLYFLFLALLNWVPVVEAFQKEITMIPLMVVLAAIAIKDALEDYRRYLFDKKVNNNVVRVFCGTQKTYVDQCWSNVRVGDFVRLSCNEIIPADILLLYSSDPHGVCYIETAHLDGETNLKQRQVVSGLPVQGEEFTPESFRSRIECENPNNYLSRFRGYIEHPSGNRVGLHSSNLLLRSCAVRNTETIVGIVIYAGPETKAMMNNNGPRYKRSKLEKQLNTDVLWCVFLLIIMCLTAAIGHGLWLKNLKDPVFQVDATTSPALSGFYTFWTMIIVLQVLIPISLYVSIEIVKLGQIFFIQNDIALYNEQLDSRIQCRALNITEDLGQIQYLFSDKTGTLTENKMVFRRCSVYGIEYPHEENGRRLKVYEAEKKDASNHSETLKSNCGWKTQSCRSLTCKRSSVSMDTLTSESAEEDEQSPSHIQLGTSSFCSRMEKEVAPDPELVRKLNWFCSSVRHLSNSSSETLPSLELTYITDFFLALAICNSVVVSSPSQPRHVVPETQSPLKSLEEMKVMFQQRFSFSPLSALSTLSPSQIRGSPYNLSRRLFRKTSSLAFSSSPKSTSDRSDPEEDSNITPSNMKGKLRLSAKDAKKMENNDTGNGFRDIETNRNAVKQGEENLTTQVGSKCNNDDELLYEAESPDEAALVHAARAYNCILKARSAESLLVDLPGIGTLAVQLLHILPFDTNRKRMSVVVRHPLTGHLVVYTKGADSVMMNLSETPRGAETEIYCHIREQTQKHLDAYAREGLRTLCFAKKVLEEEEYDGWLMRHLVAESSIENREELLLESALRLETNLTLLGTTGIVDRLQEEVPETIEALQRAGIKVWVLTGDKQETAINIAYACKLLCTNDRILTANCNSMDSCKVLLHELKLEVQCGEDSLTELTETAGATSDRVTGFILVIDGQTLEWALHEKLKSSFLIISRRCKAVICCRSTPLQKSKVVQVIRDQIGVMTLAVGDGANDVSMIQMADVGIGIAGQEGMQAVMSSDFAITRFKHLRKLLLVHGHWCYTRLANMIFYFIYKNVMYVNLLFWYQFFCGFSGSVMTNSWVLIFFNLLFTSVPPLIYGILDKDIPAETLMEVPELYHATKTSKGYGSYMFWITVLDAFYQSLVCFFVPYFAFAGSDVGGLSFGSPINASALLIILLHQVIDNNTLTWIHALVLVLSAGLYFGFVLLFSVYCVTSSPPTSMLGVETLQMSQPLFYIICVLTTVTALTPRMFFRALLNTWTDMDRLEAEKYHTRIHQWNQAHSRVCANNSGLAPSVV